MNEILPPSDVTLLRELQAKINREVAQDGDVICNVRVTITRNADGAVAISPDDWGASFCFSRYWWEEGNAACDCNRDDWFHRWRGEPEADSAQCGDGKHRVKVEDRDTGAVLYEETPCPKP